MRVLLVVLVACSSPPRPAAPNDRIDRGQPLALAVDRPLEIGSVEHTRSPDVDLPPVAAGAQVKKLAAESTGNFAFTADAKWLAYSASDGIHVVRTTSFAERVIPASSSWFVLTPDSRWLLSGARVERRSIDGGAAKRLAPDLEIHSLGHLIVSPDSKWIAFLASSGDLVIAPIDGGPAKSLSVPAPQDGRCHAGAGAVKAFSADSRWLVYQHGCDRYEAIRIDGSDRHVIEPGAKGIEAVAGQVSIGVDARSFTITPLAGGAVTTIETPPLFGFSGPKVAPDRQSFAFIADDYALYVADLAKPRLDRVSPDGLRVNSFIEHTPDSRRVLYANIADTGRCELRMFERAARRDVGLAHLAEGGQCFIKAAGNKRAVIHTWRQAAGGRYARELLLVDLETRDVRSLARDNDAGNFDVSSDGRVVVFTGSRPQWPISVVTLP